MTITYGLMENLDEILRSNDGYVRIHLKTKVTYLLLDKEGNVYGRECISRDRKIFQERDSVVIAAGGFGANSTADPLLIMHCPDLSTLPIMNGDDCAGDGLKISMIIGADCVDLARVQVHPSGFVRLDRPDLMAKLLVAEAWRDVGGVLFAMKGQRCCNALGHRDYTTDAMWESHRIILDNCTGFFLYLNSKSSKDIAWHCKHYKGRGIMKPFESTEEFAAEHKISLENIAVTFNDYYEPADKQAKDPEGGLYETCRDGNAWDKWVNKFYHSLSLETSDQLRIAIVTLAIHFCTGGLNGNASAECMNASDTVIGGLYGSDRHREEGARRRSQRRGRPEAQGRS